MESEFDSKTKYQMQENEKVEELLKLLADIEQEQARKKEINKEYNEAIKGLKARVNALRLEIQNEQ